MATPANTPATGNGPFEFTSAQGKQISIPLSAFSYDATGALVVNAAWTPLTTTQPGAALLAHALKEGLIAPRPLPSPFPAMIIKAADSGAGGNNIQVSILVTTVVTSPPSTDPNVVQQFSLTVTENDSYTGLTTATIESILASSPGLVQVVHNSIEPSATPKISTGPLTGTPAKFDVLGDGSPPVAFTLVAKKSGTDAALTKVTVTPVLSSPSSPHPSPFSLQATWTKTVTGITLPHLEATVQSEFGYEITISKPSSGAYSVPANGVVILSGGGTGSNASAVIFAGQ